MMQQRKKKPGQQTVPPGTFKQLAQAVSASDGLTNCICAEGKKNSDRKLLKRGSTLISVRICNACGGKVNAV